MGILLWSLSVLYYMFGFCLLSILIDYQITQINEVMPMMIILVNQIPTYKSNHEINLFLI